MMTSLLNRIERLAACRFSPFPEADMPNKHFVVTAWFLATLALASVANAQGLASTYVERDTTRKDLVVFVHGVTGDAKDTWTNARTGAYWPQIVRHDPRFSGANVWVFSYVSPKLQNAQNVEELALKLGDALSEPLRTHERLFFVAHSMGGLIVREMLTQKAVPATKVPLIYFFGTPSAGAELAGVAAALSQNPQFENLRPFTRESDVISFSRRWLATSENPIARYPQRVWSYCAYEIEGLVANIKIVSELSASYLCSTPPRGSLANHSTMVKPATETDEPHQYLASAYEAVRSDAAKLLAAVGGVSSHSAKFPGFDPSTLKVGYATVNSTVSCGETRRGKIAIDTGSIAKGRVLAATTLASEVAGMQVREFTPQIDAKGELSLIYRVTGADPHPTLGCPAPGRASVNVQFVIDK